MLKMNLIVLSALAYAIAFPRTGFAQSELEDFKDAQRSEGCESIPYDDLRRKCIDTMDDVVLEYCKKGKLSCDDVKRAKNDPSVKGDPEAIEELMEGNRRELELRRGWNEMCLNGRNLIHNIFDEAIDRADDESDQAIVPIAQDLIEQWERGQSKHDEAIDNAQRAFNKCKDRLNSGDY